MNIHRKLFLSAALIALVTLSSAYAQSPDAMDGRFHCKIGLFPYPNEANSIRNS